MHKTEKDCRKMYLFVKYFYIYNMNERAKKLLSFVLFVVQLSAHKNALRYGLALGHIDIGI
jgi:hypothetical protein